MLFVAATLGRSATLLLRRPPPRLARAALLCVGTEPDPPPLNPGSQTLEALRACSKRGRWKVALELLARLEAEASGEPIPAVAWHSALAACRKRERKEEALAVLHDVAERKVAARKEAAGALTLTDGLVGRVAQRRSQLGRVA